MESQKKWPYCLYHFTDITNAINILSEGFLFPRAELERTGKLWTDIASYDIIKRTSQEWKEFVRLYFRPRTPMQNVIEGIRPKNKIEFDAHCPVPIVFTFKAGEILTRQSTRFSNGNLRSKSTEVGDTVDFYLSLPFEDIYHDIGWRSMSVEEIKRIKLRRHSEVLIPKSLDFSSLEYIYCRSPAEFETLINGLPMEARSRWENKIGAINRTLFFFCDWHYIDRVFMNYSKIVFSLVNPDFHSSLFNARLEVEELSTGKKYYWEEKKYKPKKKLPFDLSNLEDPGYYKVILYLDDNLVYQNTYHREIDNDPF